MRAADRRLNIIAAARRVFLDNGLAGARTKQIAEEAGVAEAVLYRHFPSKEALFEAAVLEPLELLVENLSRVDSVPWNGNARLHQELTDRLHADFIRGMIDIMPLLGVALFSDREQGLAFYRDRLRPRLDAIDALMAESLRNVDHLPIPAELVAAAMIGVYSWLALRRNFEDLELDADAIAHDINLVFTRGLAPSRRTSRSGVQ